MSTLTLLFAWFWTMLPGNFNPNCQVGVGETQPCAAAPPAEEAQTQEDSQDTTGFFSHLWNMRHNGISNGV